MSAGRELILLVGGNPLPNYVTARALHQQGLIDRVRLLFTREEAVGFAPLGWPDGI